MRECNVYSGNEVVLEKKIKSDIKCKENQYNLLDEGG